MQKTEKQPKLTEEEILRKHIAFLRYQLEEKEKELTQYKEHRKVSILYTSSLN